MSNLYPHFPVWFRGYNQEPKSRCGRHAIDINVHLFNNVAELAPFAGYESTCPQTTELLEQLVPLATYPRQSAGDVEHAISRLDEHGAAHAVQGGQRVPAITVTFRLTGQTDFVHHAHCSRDGKRIVNGSQDKTLSVWGSWPSVIQA